MRPPPGPRGPGALNLVSYVRDPLGFFARAQRRYGDVFAVPLPSFGRVVYLAEPGLVRELFAGDPAELHAGEANATILEPAVGPRSVLTLDEAAHLRQRRLLLPPFHGRAVESYRDVILNAARRDLEQWPVGAPFSVRDRTQRITLDVILRAVFGLDEAVRRAEAHAVVAEFARCSDAIVLPKTLQRRLGPWSPWTRFLRARDALDAEVHRAIAERRASADAAERNDVLSLLMGATHEDGSQLSDEDLRDELVTVVGAGHETTATALAWAVERLVRHPAVLARLRDSLEAGEDGYVDAVIKETLRLRPVIVDVARRATVDMEIGGWAIPRGTLVLAAIAAVHLREDLYPDPWSFRPERWLEGAPDGYAWIPFGGGVRRCLGAAFAQEEMRIVLREIVLRADLRPATPRDERVKIRNITLAPEHGGRVVLRAPLRPEMAPAWEAPVAAGSEIT